jgi:hypothetical protein
MVRSKTRGRRRVIHSRTLSALAFTALALSACGPKDAAKTAKATTAPAGPTVSLPRPKAGLWEETTVISGGASQSTRICLNDEVSAQLTSHGVNPPGAACDPVKVDKGADTGVTTTTTCKLKDGGKFTSTSTETGDLQQAYTTKVQWSVTGVAQQADMSMQQTIEAKYAGPCPDGWQAGDVEQPGGQRVNLLHPAPAPPAA